MRCFYFSYHYKLPFGVYAYTFDMSTNNVYYFFTYLFYLFTYLVHTADTDTTRLSFLVRVGDVM